MTLENRPATPEALVAWALCSLDEAKTYLKRSSDDDDEIIKQIVNECSAAVELYCKRRLLSRTYDGAEGNEQPIFVSGTGKLSVVMPEWPITALASAAYRSGGTFTALDITGWYEQPKGILWLDRYAFPVGTQNVRVKCVAGYTDAHVRERKAIRKAMKRLVQVAWQDFDSATGRGTGFSVGGQSVSLIDVAIPRDVELDLAPFVRYS